VVFPTEREGARTTRARDILNVWSSGPVMDQGSLVDVEGVETGGAWVIAAGPAWSFARVVDYIDGTRSLFQLKPFVDRSLGARGRDARAPGRPPRTPTRSPMASTR